MNLLRVPLSDIVSQGVTIDTDVPVDAVRPAGAEGVPAARVHVAGHLSGTLEDVVFIGHVSGEFRQPCDRCLADTPLAFDVEVRWDLAFDDEDVWLEEDEEVPDAAPVRRRTADDAGEDIDLRAHVWEEVVLALPTKYLCRENCLGLCPACGKNLNEGPCGCHPQADIASDKLANKGFAGLADMFPDLKPKSDKE